jgi:hypothetical protein
VAQLAGHLERVSPKTMPNAAAIDATAASSR